MLGPLNGPVFAWSGGNGGVRALDPQLRLHQPRRRLHAGVLPPVRSRGCAAQPVLEHRRAVGERARREDGRPAGDLRRTSARRRRSAGSRRRSSTCPMDGIRVRWEWDADDGVYRRFQNGNSHETEDAGQVVADNIVVMGVDYHRSAVDRQQPGGPDARRRARSTCSPTGCCASACGSTSIVSTRTDSSPPTTRSSTCRPVARGSSSPTTPRTSSPGRPDG